VNIECHGLLLVSSAESKPRLGVRRVVPSIFE